MAISSRRKPAPAKSPAHARHSGPPVPEAPSAPVNERQQAELFDRAMKVLQAANYGVARGLFEQAASGPVGPMAHSARLHAAMCTRRLAAASEPALRTPDEHYDYAVALINERRFAQAESHLAEAMAKMPDADHIHYALALCRGLAGDLRSAYRHLRRAIEIQPRNRTAARNDPDFAAIARLSPLFELLYPERTAAVQPRS
jgi:tetratricopeptide (TPR) repeat protein